MTIKTVNKTVFLIFLLWALSACRPGNTAMNNGSLKLPATYNRQGDSLSTGTLSWKNYFSDSNLVALIDTALVRNQELNIALREINIGANEVRARKGEYLPFLRLQGGGGVEKSSRFTREGAVEDHLTVAPGKPFPEPLTDVMGGLFASWELDVWQKLRNAKRAAAIRYLAGIQGRHFIMTNLVAEIANTYYELMALDNLVNIVHENVKIQTDALGIVKQQKDAAKLTQLAVNRFEAQLLNTQSLEFELRQRVVEAENRINVLTGGVRQPIRRESASFINLSVDTVHAGIPSMLLRNRPDVRKAELQLAAAKLDVKAARANFYPSLSLSAGIGYRAFNPAYLIQPEGLIYNLAGDLMAPLVNRNAIRANYQSANERQIQELLRYEQTILNAYVEVVNQLAQVENSSQGLKLKTREVDILMQSVDIANNLFRFARADYLEILLTQREALKSKMELMEIKLKQMNARVNVYRALGGGWN
jgi:NodT family efflux transporter outer membrane factor (OMF) lipoprotein